MSSLFENCCMLTAAWKISNRLLVSVTLIALPPHLHSAHPLSSVLNTLSSELDSISSRVSAYSSGLSLFPSSLSSSSLDSPSLLLIDNCLRLLDSFLLGRWTAEVEEGYGNDRLGSQREGGLATALMNLCAACDVISRDDEYLDQFTTGMWDVEIATCNLMLISACSWQMLGIYSSGAH